MVQLAPCLGSEVRTGECLKAVTLSRFWTLEQRERWDQVCFFFFFFPGTQTNWLGRCEKGKVGCETHRWPWAARWWESTSRLFSSGLCPPPGSWGCSQVKQGSPQSGMHLPQALRDVALGFWVKRSPLVTGRLCTCVAARRQLRNHPLCSPEKLPGLHFL